MRYLFLLALLTSSGAGAQSMPCTSIASYWQQQAAALQTGQTLMQAHSSAQTFGLPVYYRERYDAEIFGNGILGKKLKAMTLQQVYDVYLASCQKTWGH